MLKGISTKIWIIERIAHLGGLFFQWGQLSGLSFRWCKRRSADGESKEVDTDLSYSMHSLRFWICPIWAILSVKNEPFWPFSCSYGPFSCSYGPFSCVCPPKVWSKYAYVGYPSHYGCVSLLLFFSDEDSCVGYSSDEDSWVGYSSDDHPSGLFFQWSQNFYDQ